MTGVLASAFAIGVTPIYLPRVFGIGSLDMAAPRATLMATIVQGLLGQRLQLAIPSRKSVPNLHGDGADADAAAALPLLLLATLPGRAARARPDDRK